MTEPAPNPSPSTEHTSVGIVIPVHNEGDFLAHAIGLIADEIASVPAHVTVFVVENGSTDDTLGVAQACAAEHDWISVLSLSTPNYGLAMREGFRQAAESDWIVNFDIDYFSGPFVADLLTSAEDADVVIASKRDPGSDDRRSLLRRLATRVFNLILRLVLHSGVSDTHGIKGFRSGVVRSLLDQVRHNEDLFDTELVLRAERAGFRIREVPIVVEELRAARSSLLRRVPRTLRGIVQMRRALSSDRLNTTSR